MRLSKLAVAAIVLVLAGCNTMYQKSFEKVLVRTPGVDNAECDLYTDHNRYNVMTTREVVVERSKDELRVVCRKTGYYTASVVVKSHIKAPKAALNVLNGFVPGMAYDYLDNSIYDYPNTIVVTLLPEPPAPADPGPAPYVLQKKQENIKPAPVATAPPAAAADKSLSKSLRK